MTATAVAPAALRDAIGHLATGVTIVSTIDATGEPCGTTASAVSSLSLEPPLVLVCLARSSLTLAALRDHRAFAINVLAKGQEELSARFARRGAAAAWDGVAHGYGPTGVPRLDGSLTVLHCTLRGTFEGGDHEIVVGCVDALQTAGTSSDPLVHYRGAYATVAPG